MSTDADIIAQLSCLGGYFALPRSASTAQQAFVPYARLADPDVVARFVAATRAATARAQGIAIDTIPASVAASSFQLGVAARLLSPMIAAALCHNAVPMLTSSALSFAADGHSPVFTVGDVEIRPTGNVETAAGAVSELLTDLFDPLNRELRNSMRLSEKICRGNLISAANGAVTVLAMSLPDIERDGRALIRALSSMQPLADTAHHTRGRFTRRSCCLFYKVPGAGLCGDCVLTELPGSHDPVR
ncbi:(2Fe-2S)-binding protein [Mycolicibacterium sp. A43C]